MALLLQPAQVNTRPRAISNGGLGGCVLLERAEQRPEPRETGTWPSRRKNRPPPLKICFDNRQLLVPAPQRSAVWPGSKETRSPRTPTGRGSDTARLVVMADSPTTCSTPLSRFHISAVTHNFPPRGSLTPATLPSKPVELPGSLLLPSQGLEPPPFTPPRPFNLTRRNTDDSDLGSVPSLVSSTSSSSADMDRFRGWKPAVSTGTTPTASTAVSKPFTTMSTDELFEALPKCNPFAITQMWIPAMKDNYKKHLREPAEQSQKSNEELTNIGKDLRLFTEEVRTISNTYSNALKSAESLLERDTSDLEEGLRIFERKYREERTKVEASAKTIKEKDDTIGQLESTLKDVVRVLGTFIQDNILRWVDSFHAPSTQAVMQVISDYTNIISENTTRYVRVSESTHTKNLNNLREAQANVQKWRAVAQSSGTIIKEQSEQQDRHIQKYEQCLMRAHEKTQEALALEQKRSELEQKNEEYEAALLQSRAAVAELQSFRKHNDVLAQKLQELSKTVEDRDVQIAELRSQLGSAREEVLARKADVRNVIVQSQALLGSTETSDTSSQSSSSKARKVLGKSRDKSRPKQSPFLHNHTGLNLGFGRPLNTDLMSSPPDPKYSSKEVVSKSRRPSEQQSSTTSTPSSIYSQDSKETQRPNDPFHDARPRGDSLGALDAMRQMVRSPRADTQKQLPTPPPTILAKPPSHPPPAPPHKDSPMPKAGNYRDFQAYPEYTPQQTARRILSDIPEASVEDNESPRAPSATSSDREVYRRSIRALNALSSFESRPDLGTPVSMEEVAEGIDRVESHSSDGSDVQTVSQMYHHGPREHFRS